MSVSPTQRTLAALREQGRKCAIVEKWNPYAGVRQDLFGFIDIIALERDGLRGIIGVQSTGSAFAAHERKLLEERREACIAWLLAGGEIELWGWRKLKVKRGGKATCWTPRVRTFELEDFDVQCED
jgi:hypothetical protein